MALPKALALLSETDLSLLEQAAVFRIAAETCTQAQQVQEMARLFQQHRKGGMS